MMRNIISIDESKCDGCGLCIPGCPEGAIQVIDGKARLVSDLMCDGLGACLGTCPQGAITVEQREAEPYDERRVMENIVRQGSNTIRAHLKHLKDHNETAYYAQAVAFLQERGISLPAEAVPHRPHGGGCPGAAAMAFERPAGQSAPNPPAGAQPSELRHWPIQMHLVSPGAPHYHGADLLLAADCVAYTVGDFHQTWLKGKTLAIACPKLDQNQDIYLQKLVALIEDAKINTLTVMIMQVPCCRGLLGLAQQAVAAASRKVPLKAVIVSLQGQILDEQWM